jgi:hypothetical protein
MTALLLLPALALVIVGGLLTWPVAYRAGQRGADDARVRDQAEIGRILTGLERGAARAALPAVESAQLLGPSRYQPRHRRRWGHAIRSWWNDYQDIDLPVWAELQWQAAQHARAELAT